MTDEGEIVGHVAEVWRYPVKSFQGFAVDRADLTATGFAGDRRWALVDGESGHVLAAKRTGALLEASATDDAVTLPDGTALRLGDAGVDEQFSAWLGRPVELREASTSAGLSYEMTFDPPNDDAEAFEIPVVAGTFFDLAAVHLVTTATLAGCTAARPDLDWDVRRFRPNVVLAVDDDAFVEEGWSGAALRLGGAEVDVLIPTVRCAMPLRAQPANGGAPALDRQPELFRALEALNTASPNHLGCYASVRTPGVVAVGDPVAYLR